MRAKLDAGGEVLDLTESNPTQAGFDYPRDAILAALADPRALEYEPHPAGLRSAREAVSGYYAERGFEVDPDRILLTAGTSEAYAYLFKLLCDPGDVVLAPRPSYPLFDYLAALESVRIVQYPLACQEGWWLDFDALEAAIPAAPGARAIVLVNPDNPTGSYLKHQELERLAGLCRKHGLALISDEVFADFAHGPDPHRVVTLADLDSAPAFVTSGLSKVAGLPQMKLGWIVAAGPEGWRRDALARLELIADTYLSVGTPVQHAAGALLATGGEIARQMLARVLDNLAFLRSRVEESPFRVLAVEGGWYATLEAPRTRSEEEWVIAGIERGVLVQPGFYYDFESEAYLVLSLLTRGPVFRPGVERLLAL